MTYRPVVMLYTVLLLYYRSRKINIQDPMILHVSYMAICGLYTFWECVTMMHFTIWRLQKPRIFAFPIGCVKESARKLPSSLLRGIQLLGDPGLELFASEHGSKPPASLLTGEFTCKTPHHTFIYSKHSYSIFCIDLLLFCIK